MWGHGGSVPAAVTYGECAFFSHQTGKISLACKFTRKWPDFAFAGKHVAVQQLSSVAWSASVRVLAQMSARSSVYLTAHALLY